MEQKNEIDWEAVDMAARAAGVPYFTHRKWKARKRIPSHWWPRLIEFSDGKLTADVFMSAIPAPPEVQKVEAAE